MTGRRASWDFIGGPEPNDGANIWRSSGPSHQWWPKQKTPATPWEAQIDKDFINGAHELDPAKRKKFYDDWQEIVAQQQPFIFTVTTKVCGDAQPLRQYQAVGLMVWAADVVWNIEEIFDTKATGTARPADAVMRKILPCCGSFCDVCCRSSRCCSESPSSRFCIMKLAPGDFPDPDAGQPADQARKRSPGCATTSDWTCLRLSSTFYWLRNGVRGNFGYSFAYHLPVFKLIGIYTLGTLLLATDVARLFLGHRDPDGDLRGDP